MKTKKPDRSRRLRLAVFHPEFREDLEHWVAGDRAIALRILLPVEHVLRDPFEGIGKPEPLRFYMQGCWSRRITQEHRLVYLVREGGSTSSWRSITTEAPARVILSH